MEGYLLLQYEFFSFSQSKKKTKQKPTANTARYDSDLLTAPCSYFLSNTV